MTSRIVKTQAELDQAIADKIDLIEIHSPQGVWLTIKDLGSSRAELWGSSRAELRGSSSAHAYAKSKVKASPLCAVFLHESTVDISGGVVIDHSSIGDMDGSAWCEYHGVKVSRGIATVYKAVNDQWTTSRGFDYSPGSKPSCDDFRADNACGGGLHFGPTPLHAKAYFKNATKFVAVGVKVSEL